MREIHQKVLFVGDKPNPRKNIHLEVPFVGTTSYKKLLEWIYRMDLDIHLVDIANAYDVTGQPQDLESAYTLGEYKVVALGDAAAERLKQIPKVVYFKLPHPSGANKKGNDTKSLTTQLTKCKKWIYNEKEVK